MERNRPRRNSFLRMALVGISVLLQAGWLLLVVLKLNRHFWWLSAVTSLLGALAVLHLYSKHTTSAMKMPWIMLMLVFPVMGLSLYLMLVLLGDVGNQKKYLEAAKAKIPVPQQELELPLDASAGNIARYISRYAEENGVVLNPSLEIGSNDLLINFAKINLGLTYVIRELTKELEEKKLYEIPVNPPIPKRSIGMVRLKNVAMSHALQGFIDLMNLPKQ